MKPIYHLALLRFAVVVLIALTATGCRSTDSAQTVEDMVLNERIYLNILAALDSDDPAKARKLAETPMLVDASTLPYYAANGHLRPGQKEAMITYARKILDYMEQHRSELKSRPHQIRPAVLGLQKTLTGPEDVRRLEELSDYFAGADNK